MRIVLNDIIYDEAQNKKDQVLLSLRKSIPIVNKFVLSQLRQRRLIIEADPNSAESNLEIYRDEKVNKINYDIKFGIDTADKGIMDRMLFNANMFTSDNILEYKLLRKLCECIVHELQLKNNTNMQSLITLVSNQHLQDKKFFTLFGSYDDSIKHSDYPEAADVAELIAMYLWDTSYFAKYFRFVVSDLENDLEIKKAFGVRTVIPTTAKIIQELVNSISLSI